MVSLVSAHLSNLELGFGHATIRYLARARGAHDLAGERAVLNTSLVVFWVGGAIGGIAFVLAAPVLATRFFHIPPALQPEAIVVFRLGGAILTASFLSSFFGAALQGLGRFDWMNGSRLAFGTVAAVVAVSRRPAGPGVSGSDGHRPARHWSWGAPRSSRGTRDPGSGRHLREMVVFSGHLHAGIATSG
jgi:O-antigen/teichoic acid export membrane protein